MNDNATEATRKARDRDIVSLLCKLLLVALSIPMGQGRLSDGDELLQPTKIGSDVVVVDGMTSLCHIAKLVRVCCQGNRGRQGN